LLANALCLLCMHGSDSSRYEQRPDARVKTYIIISECLIQAHTQPRHSYGP